MAKAKAAEYTKLNKAMKDAAAALKSAKDEKAKTAAAATLKTAKAEFGAYQFKTLAGKRVSKALASMENVAKLGGRGYVSTPEQQAKIFAAFEAKMAAMRIAFSTQEKKAAAVFEV